MSSLEETERVSAEQATAPRVSLVDIEEAIAVKAFTNGLDALPAEVQQGLLPSQCERLRLTTICFLVMKNGFVVTGITAPASPENYRVELGEQFSYENAARQLWPLLGYELCSELSRTEAPVDAT